MERRLREVPVGPTNFAENDLEAIEELRRPPQPIEDVLDGQVDIQSRQIALVRVCDRFFQTMLEPFVAKQLLLKPVQYAAAMLVLEEPRGDLVVSPVCELYTHIAGTGPAGPFRDVLPPAIHRELVAVLARVGEVQGDTDD